MEKPNVIEKDEALNKEKANDIAVLEMDAQNLVSEDSVEKYIEVVVSKKVAKNLVPLNSDFMQEVGESGLVRAYPLNDRNLKDEQCQALDLVGSDEMLKNVDVAQVQGNIENILVSSMGEEIVIANLGDRKSFWILSKALPLNGF